MILGTDRSKNILARVRMLLGQNDDTILNNDLVYAVATAKSVDIAETYMCVESTLTLPVVSGTNTYTLTALAATPTVSTGFFRLKLLAPPLTSRVTIVEFDVNQFDFARRYMRVSTGLPIFYINIYGGVLTFYPTPTVTENWTISFYKSPSTVISKAVGPETPSSFDTALIYGALSELAPLAGKGDQAMIFMQMYEAEKQRGLEAYRGTRTESQMITYQDI